MTQIRHRAAPDANDINVLIAKFLKTKNPYHLFGAASQLYAEDRLVEFLFGAWCFARYRPAGVQQSGFTPPPDLLETLTGGDAMTLRELAAAQGLGWHLDGLDPSLNIRRQSLVCQADWLLAGEYAEKSATLILVTRGGARTIDFYNRQGVRHIHSIHALDATHVLISTGDAKKYCDLWWVEAGTAQFVRRVLSRFGGFTASARVADDHYFGSDWSGRPNYLWRLRDAKKFFFPGSAFTSYVRKMAPLRDGHLACVNYSILDRGHATLTVFDTTQERFVHLQELHVAADMLTARGPVSAGIALSLDGSSILSPEAGTP